jgi:hypothetical protein
MTYNGGSQQRNKAVAPEKERQMIWIVLLVALAACIAWFVGHRKVAVALAGAAGLLVAYLAGGRRRQAAVATAVAAVPVTVRAVQGRRRPKPADELAGDHGCDCDECA